ncbi:MAG: McrC family protein [Chloroflexota bacterium]|nr:McrC family protein [Chloroflexota bacterium]
MQPQIELTEYETWTGSLTADDASFIASTLSQRITIARRPVGEAFTLNPNQFVGVVVLPTQTTIRCRTKVPVASLFHMLSVAYDLPPEFRPDLTGYAREDEIVEFVVRYFAGAVERQIENGLYRAYAEQEDNLAFVRGRIVFAEDIRRNYVLRHRIYCRFDEFTWDVIENQLIRQVVHTLADWILPDQLRLRFARLDATLDEISPTSFVSDDIDRVQYHRLNESYRSLHALCRLFMEAASISEHPAGIEFQSFLIDMNKLFELFVTKALNARASVYGMNVLAQESLHLTEGGRVVIQPDLLVRSHGDLVLAADCKYKRISIGEFKNHDLYQLLAYCIATRVERGLLIYPRHRADVVATERIRNANIQVRESTMNLSLRPGDLDSECDRLAREVFEWAAIPAAAIA